MIMRKTKRSRKQRLFLAMSCLSTASKNALLGLYTCIPVPKPLHDIRQTKRLRAARHLKMATFRIPVFLISYTQPGMINGLFPGA
jgi:hypothetical protein